MLLYFIGLYVLVVRHSSAQFVCPSSFGLFSDPLRCTNYYECESFVPTSKVCGSGLYFNQDMKICDWPSNVQCSASVDSSSGSNANIQAPNGNPQTNIQNSNHITFRCHQDGLYEDPVSCNHFVECNNGSPYRKICPANLWFDIRIKACNWPESMECVKHTRPLITERPKPTSQPPSTFTPTYATPPPDNDYNRPDDYNQPDRKPDRTTKPPHRPTTAKPRTTTTTESYNNVNNNCDWCFKCPNLEDKYYENSYDKFTYYHCYKGEAFLMYCPKYENWIQRKQVCEPVNNRNEDKPPTSDDDNSSEDGAGLIDPRMKPRMKVTSKPGSRESLSLRQALPNVDKKVSSTTKRPQTTTSNHKPTASNMTTTAPIHRGTKPNPTTNTSSKPTTNK